MVKMGRGAVLAGPHWSPDSRSLSFGRRWGGGGRLIRKFLSEEDVEKKDLISARQKESFLLIHDQ